MHACGHDMLVTCLLGAASELAASRADWSGTVVVVFQPAEELAKGAASMVADRVFERVPRPDVVLGQRVTLDAGDRPSRTIPAEPDEDEVEQAEGHG